MLAACLLALAPLPAPVPQASPLTWQTGQRIQGIANDRIVLDGDRAVVASYEMVQVYQRQAGVWALTATLSSPFGGGDGFGSSVALWGNRIAVGAPSASTSEQWPGAVFVFVDGGSSWSLEYQFANPVSGVDFGDAVALGPDILLVGHPLGGTGSSSGKGLVHVVDRLGGVWTPGQILEGQSLPFGPRFGWALDLDGDTLAVAEPFTTWFSTPTHPGSVSVFTRSGGTWSLQQRLFSVDGALDGFGLSLGLDADTLIVGAPWADSETGAAYVFARSGGAWSVEAKLLAAGSVTGDRFGEAVALDGDLATVGAPVDDHADCVSTEGTFTVESPGSAYVFRRGPSSGVWSEQAWLTSPDPAFREGYGRSLALDGARLFVGADREFIPVEPLAHIEGMALDPASGTLFGTDVRTDELVSIDRLSAAKTPIGLLGFREVKGLAWDPAGGVLYGSDVDTDQLLEIDPVEGTAVAVGPLGYGNVEGLALDPASGRLYGVERSCAPLQGGTLLLIDTGTGAASEIGPLGAEDLVSLAWHLGSGQLYGVALNGELCKIDTATGAAASVAAATSNLRGLAFGDGGDMYSADRLLGRLWIVNRFTGGADAVTQADNTHALARDPVTNTLYGVDRKDGALARFDDVTGESTFIGPVGFDEIGGLAFDSVAGVLYAADDLTDQLIRIDPVTGAGTAVGAFGTGIGSVEALALVPSTGVLWGVTGNAGRLLSIDKSTGVATETATIGTRVWGLAPDGAGGLYGMDANEDLLAIDPVAGTWSVVASTIGARALSFDFGLGTRVDGISGTTGELLFFDTTTGALQQATKPPSGAVHEYLFDPVVAYCTAGTSASGCQAALSAAGSPSASLPEGFSVTASGVEGASAGLFFFGANGRQANPWGNGSSFQCVVPPVQRGGVLTPVGSAGACDGGFVQDLNALWCPSCPKPGANPGAGATVQVQLWYRDPGSTSNQTTSLSDALEFPLGP